MIRRVSTAGSQEAGLGKERKAGLNAMSYDTFHISNTKRTPQISHQPSIYQFREVRMEVHLLLIAPLLAAMIQVNDRSVLAFTPSTFSFLNASGNRT